MSRLGVARVSPPGDGSMERCSRQVRNRISIEGADSAPTFYDSVGGHDTFEALVSGFYARVAQRPGADARSIPTTTGRPPPQRLLMFLEQYWGGPHTYAELRGHPRLRMRHAGFVIDAAARDAWLATCAPRSTTWRSARRPTR